LVLRITPVRLKEVEPTLESVEKQVERVRRVRQERQKACGMPTKLLG